MDWQTHVVLATRLLRSCGLDPGAAVYATLPTIDRHPAHYRGVYAHTLDNFRDVLDVALEIFGSTEFAARDFTALHERMRTAVRALDDHREILPVSDERGWHVVERKIYALTRIVHEAPAFAHTCAVAGDLVGDLRATRPTTDRLAAAVSLLSHTYFDLWLRPVQFFLPDCAFASARWHLWTRTDFMRFRGEFSHTEHITRFREAIAAHPLWNTPLNPEPLVKSLIIRMGDLGAPTVPYEVVDWGIRRFLRYLGIDQYQRAIKEIDFCHDLEEEIDHWILETFPRGDATPAGSPGWRPLAGWTVPNREGPVATPQVPGTAVTGRVFVRWLLEAGFNFFTGVPCSLMQSVFAHLAAHGYVQAAREDAAVGMATGAYLGGKQPVVLMQNSGLGQSLDALSSLALLYRIPCLLLIGWRGYGGKDAPEHLLTGQITPTLLETLRIPYQILDEDTAAQDIRWAAERMRQDRTPVALLLRKGVVT
jgi:sulfopyruvate decarboxylase subunit alpha